MFIQTVPKVISEDLYKYLNTTQKITDKAVCPVFIEQLIEEVCKNVNREKFKEYKIEIKKYDLSSEEDFQILENDKFIIFNLQTSKELGEAFPLYLGKKDEINNITIAEHSICLNQRDAVYVSDIKKPILVRPKCKHIKVLDLYIIAD